MSSSLKNVGAITLFVEDLQRSKLFYQDVFSLPVAYEDKNSAAFGFENTIIHLLKIPAARDLIEPGAVASREAGSRFQLTIWVDDVDAVCAELDTRGVALLNGPMNREWGKRTASFTDPDGNIRETAQELPQAVGSYSSGIRRASSSATVAASRAFVDALVAVSAWPSMQLA